MENMLRIILVNVLDPEFYAICNATNLFESLLHDTCVDENSLPKVVCCVKKGDMTINLPFNPKLLGQFAMHRQFRLKSYLKIGEIVGNLDVLDSIEGGSEIIES